MAAEILLRNIWGDTAGILVTSAGTNAGPYGASIPRKALDWIKSLGYGIIPEKTASKPVTVELLNWADRIVYMQPKHEKMLQMLFEGYPFGDKLRCIGDYHTPNKLFWGISGPPLKNKAKFNKKMETLYECVLHLSATDWVKRTPRPKVMRFPRQEDKGEGVIINVRGINGSGKSKIMFDLIERFKATPMKDENGDIWAYDLNTTPNTFILGSYETETGGCDVIPTMEMISKQVWQLAQAGSVLFEGIIVSGTAVQWLYLVGALDKHKFIFGCMDTPIAECYARRVIRDGHCNVLNLKQKYKFFQRSFRTLASFQAEFNNVNVRMIPHLKATKTVLKWLEEAKIKPRKLPNADHPKK
jgi:protein-tyrosine-phosphatase